MGGNQGIRRREVRPGKAGKERKVSVKEELVKENIFGWRGNKEERFKRGRGNFERKDMVRGRWYTSGK